MWVTRGNCPFFSGFLALLAVAVFFAFAASRASGEEDVTPPVIALLGGNPHVQDCTGVYSDAGATVSDNSDPAPMLLVDASNVNPDSAGTYTVVYTATDATGNVSTATRTVIVEGAICELGICDITGIAFDTSVNTRYLVPQAPGSVDLLLKSSVAFTGPCAPEVTYEVDGVVAGASADAANGYPVSVNLVGGATYLITATAQDAATGETATAQIAVTVDIGWDEIGYWDQDGNGYPDRPFEALMNLGGRWDVVVDSANCERVVALRPVPVGPDDLSPRPRPPLTIAIENPSNPAQVITITLPRMLLESGGWHILIVALSCDPESLLAPEDSTELTEDLLESPLPAGLYVEVSIIISTDFGMTFAEIGPDRVAENPIFVSLSGVELTPGYRAYVFSHPTFFDNDTEFGLNLVTESGAWDNAAIENTHYHQGVLTFETSHLSAFGVFEEPALPPTLEVTPNPAFTRFLGIVEADASVNVTYTVKNIGSGVVSGSASIIGGNGAFSLLGTTAYTLATDQEQQIALRFAPPAAGGYSASIRFTNGADAITAELQGTGVARKAANVLGCGARGEAPGGAKADFLVALAAAALLLASCARRKRRAQANS